MYKGGANSSQSLLLMPDAPTSEDASDFVCQCEELVRCCAGEPFYEEHEGKRFCVLHFPGVKKLDAFLTAVGAKLENQDFEFRGVWFPDEVSTFINFQFTERANFTSATFSGTAKFNSANFQAGANFGRVIFQKAAEFDAVTFHEQTQFDLATFLEVADFNSAVFSSVSFISVAFKGRAQFSYATFEDNAQFSHSAFGGSTSFISAVFRARVFFTSASFNAGANFSYANFEGVAFFNGAAFAAKVSFSYATFKSEAQFRLAKFGAEAYFSSGNFKGAMYFSGAMFSSDAFFRYSSFGGKIDFAATIFGSAANFREASFGDYVEFSGNEHNHMFTNSSSLDMQFVRIEKPDRVSFHTLALSPHWFINVEPRKFDFTNVYWNNSGEAKPELEILKGKDVAGSHRLLAITCRHLAANAEGNDRYREASDFRRMSMDAERLATWRGFDVRKLNWWYWLASGYGERPFQALLVLIGISLLFGLLYTRVGFARWEPRLASEVDVATAKKDEVGGPLKFSRALSYSAGVITLQRPEPKPATNAAQTLVLLETILGPLQAALLALAIRRKFMR